jgi:hypothetical protein
MLWSQNIKVFLRGRRLWCYVSGETVAPTQREGESADKFASRFDDWDNANYRIISWFINTSVPSIHSLVPKLGNVKAAWEFLAKQYNCTYDSSLEFQIETKLYQTRQELGQSIADFYSQTNSLWEQLSAVDPQLKNPEDVEIFAKYRDRRKFMHFIMALCADFEPPEPLYYTALLFPH